MTTAQAIRQAMTGMTTAELAKRSGVSYDAIQKILYSGRQPGLKTFCALAKGLGTTPAKLIARIDWKAE